MTRRKPNRSTLSLECLENRQLMAGDISYDSSTKTLTVVGEQYNDTVLISFTGNEVKADLKAQRSNGSYDHSDRTKRISDVQRIVVVGAAGNDNITVVQNALSSGVNLNNLKIEVQAGAGNDYINNGSSARSDIFGGQGDDVIYGGSANDNLWGEDGIDNLFGNQGFDTLRGGAGDDLLRGGSESDYLYGDIGNDRLYGDAGADNLYGGDGQDILWGGTENDTLKGDAGDDVIYGEAGADLVFGGLGNDWADGGSENDIMQGEDGNDTLLGNSGNDLMTGGNGNDSLTGGTGEDNLYGDAGDDILDGGYDGQFDYLVGGGGVDTFYSKVVRKIAPWYEIVIEEDWVSDLTSSDIVKKRYL